MAVPHGMKTGTPMHIEENPNRRKRRRNEPYVHASPVKTTRADGTIDEQPAYTPSELRRIKQ